MELLASQSWFERTEPSEERGGCSRALGQGAAGGVNSAWLYSRFAKYYRNAEGVDYRTLIKAYGIRFDVMVNGKVRLQARARQSLEGQRRGTLLSGRGVLGQEQERALALRP